MSKDIIERPDWSLPATEQVPAEQLWNDWGGVSTILPTTGDLNPELARAWGINAGQFLAQAQSAATNILERVSDPASLEEKFDSLPESMQSKIIDQLRISPAKGRGEAAIIAFEDAMTDEEFPTWKQWVEDLTPDERHAIVSYLDGRRA